MANLPPSAVPVPVPEAQQAPSDDSKGEDVQKPSWKERLANQLPIVSMHLHRDAAGVKYGVDVWGSKTYLVKDDVLKPFGMTYDYIEQCWNKKVSVSVSLSSEGEVEADGSDGLVYFEANLRDALGALGVELRVLDPRAPTTAPAPAPAQVLPVVPARVPARVVPVGISAVSSMPSPAIGTSDVIGASVASVASDASDNIVHMQSKTGPTGTVCSIEVWGLKTIEVKEDVLKPFGMTWDRTKKRWCKNGSTATIEENSKGINVNLVIDGVESLAFRSMLRTKLGKVGAVLQVEEAEQV